MTTSTSGDMIKSLPTAVFGIVLALLVSGASTVMSGELAPILFLICIVGMVVVTILEIRKERIEKEGRRRVNYRKLAATDIDKLLSWLKENVRGHDEVIEAIFQHLKKSVQLARPGRTLGNFLLVGPTGTGKTHLAQLVGEGLFPQSEVVLLNMNQYRLPGDVYTLTGPPPGMPGCENGGRLTRPVMEDPYRVIVFDALEKAHRDVHDCLYEILDTATCREKSSGELVDFSGCVFFATSGAGVEKLRELLGEVGNMTSSAWLSRSRDALAEAAKFDRVFSRAGTAYFCWTGWRPSTWPRSPASNSADTGRNMGWKSTMSPRNSFLRPSNATRSSPNTACANWDGSSGSLRKRPSSRPSAPGRLR